MKSLLLLSACALCASLALPAPAKADPPKVTIQPDLSATVDGAPAGTIVDLLATREAVRPQALDALTAWAQEIQQKKAEQQQALAELANQQQALDDLKTSIRASLQALLAEELKTGDGPKAAKLRESIALLE